PRLVLRRVHVGYQPNRGTCGAGHRREDVTVLCQLGVVETELAQLLLEHPTEVELLRGARVRLRVLIGGRVDADVPEEALEDVVLQLGLAASQAPPIPCRAPWPRQPLGPRPAPAAARSASGRCSRAGRNRRRSSGSPSPPVPGRSAACRRRARGSAV